MYFAKDDSGILHKVRDDGSTRAVIADDPCYLAWLDQGGVLGEMPVVPGPTLPDLKAQSCDRIEAKRQEILAAGITIRWPDGEVSKVQTRNAQDWINIQGVAAAGLALLTQGMTTETWFRDADNADHTLTPTQAVDFGFQVTAAAGAIAKVAQQGKDAVNAAADEGMVKVAEAAIVWPSGGNIEEVS